MGTYLHGLFNEKNSLQMFTNKEKELTEAVTHNYG